MLLKEAGLKLGDAVRLEADKEHEAIIIRHGKKQNQLSLGLKVRPSLGAKNS